MVASALIVRRGDHNQLAQEIQEDVAKSVKVVQNTGSCLVSTVNSMLLVYNATVS